MGGSVPKRSHVFAIKLDPDTHDRLRVIAARRGDTTACDVAREALDAFLEVEPVSDAELRRWRARVKADPKLARDLGGIPARGAA